MTDVTPTKIKRQPCRESKLDRVAQYYQRTDGKWTFRVPRERRHKYARDFVGNDDGWETIRDLFIAMREAKIKHVVRIDAP